MKVINNIINMYNKKSSLQVKNNIDIQLKVISSSSKPLSMHSASTAADSELALGFDQTEYGLKAQTKPQEDENVQNSPTNSQDQMSLSIKSISKSGDSSKLNCYSKFIAQKQKIKQIKAKQLELKKKAEIILSNSSSNSSPMKSKSSGSQVNLFLAQNSNISLSPSKKAIYSNPISIKQVSESKTPTRQTIKIKHNQNMQTFLILKYIDEGCFGKVYLVKHETTNFIYCLKMIDRTFLDQNSFNQLIRQIKIQSFLNHPNIVNIYQFFVDQYYVYLLLQPCLGGNLFKYMSKNKNNCLMEKEVKKYIKEIAKAIEYLHKHNIIHRDIKPQNILLHQNSAKLCDFGWAVYSPLMRDTQCGTPLYASPEIIKSEHYDSKIDIWCIGVLTFELLFGQPPFKITNIHDMVKIVDEEVYFPSQIDVSWSAIEFMKGCLQKKAVRRFEIRQVLDHQFLIHNGANDKFRNTIV